MQNICFPSEVWNPSLRMFNFVKLAVHQPCMRSVSDCSKLQHQRILQHEIF